MIGEKHMRSKTSLVIAPAVIAVALSLSLFSSAAPQAAKKTSSASQPAQKAFATPKQAAEALVQAAADFNVPELTRILGPDGESIVSSADPVRDKNNAAAFAAEAREKMQVTTDPKNPRRAIVSVGNEDWPLPIPLVQRAGKWYFDTKAGRQEILYRRIGANELDAIAVCRGYVDAQEEYSLQKHGGVNQYAQRIISTPGKQDGLVWKNPDGSLGGPIAQPIADAIQQGYSNRGQPFHGYYFKILKGQGPNAPLGSMNFVVNGVMIGGYALAAAPAQYRVTGVKTFIVSYEGIVYQKDLGPNTLEIFRKMEIYNPDKTWQPTNASW
jgi:Protein of unknown function (DUF2950)